MNPLPTTRTTLALWVALLATHAPQDTPQEDKLKVGDLLPRIVCPEEYEARVFAIDLKAPDGLALDSNGHVLVVEETAGRVTRITSDGTHEVVASGFHSPEGICVGEHGEFFVVEDCANGRLLRIDAQGEQTVLVTGLDASEGVLYLDNTVYFTESDAQLITNRFALRTRVSSISRLGGARGKFGEPKLIIERRLPYSFSELASNGNEELLIANEIANSVIPAGLVRLNLATKKLDIFASELYSPEGLCRADPEGIADLPLLVAEEQILGETGGRISLIERATPQAEASSNEEESTARKVAAVLPGKRTTFATGFLTIEDVVVAPNGSIYVTEDISSMIIELRPKPQPMNK